MEKAKVYFSDFRTKAFGDGLPAKLKKLIKKAGVKSLNMEGKFVAIKLHFGELGNISYLRPNYSRAVADVVKEFGGKPFLTDCNTMYPGQPEKCFGAFGMCLGKWLHAADRRLSDTHWGWVKRHRRY